MFGAKILAFTAIAAQLAVGFELEKRFELPEHLALLKREAQAVDEASYDCHANCGYAILAVYNCSSNGDETAPFNQDCLCDDDSTFNSLMPACLDCGWCLYTDYWPYLETAIASCATIPITPTGSTCSPTSAYSIIALDLDVSGSAAGNSSASASVTGASSSLPISSFLSSSAADSSAASSSAADSSSASASASASSSAVSSASTGLGNTLKVSGIVGFAGLAFLMI